MAEAARPPLAQWLLALGVALALSGAFLAWRHWPAPAPPALPPAASLASATRVDDPVPLPAFALRTSEGALGNADLLGHWTLIDFGYTFCPDVCPTTLATLKEVRARLRSAGQAPPQALFISVDPARDTTERLRDYVRFFDPAFVAATGDDAALAPLARHLGVRYERHIGHGESHYAVDHSTGIYLVDPQGRLKATFSWPHDPAQMVDDYAQLTSGDRTSP